MRTNFFGEKVIESVSDDLGAAIAEADGDLFAVISTNEEGDGFIFEVRDNESGETVVSSDPIFNDVDAARTYLRGWFSVSDIDVN